MKVVVGIAPEPSLAKVSSFTTDPDDPVVFWFNVGISVAASVLKLGSPLLPLGAAKTKF